MTPIEERKGREAFLAVCGTAWAIVALPWLFLAWAFGGYVFLDAEDFRDAPVYSALFMGVIYGVPLAYLILRLFRGKGASK